jgi:hypothetical protein
LVGVEAGGVVGASEGFFMEPEMRREDVLAPATEVEEKEEVEFDGVEVVRV